jgi:hypothetical protein
MNVRLRPLTSAEFRWWHALPELRYQVAESPTKLPRLQQDEAAGLRDGFPTPIAYRDASETGH